MKTHQKRDWNKGVRHRDNKCEKYREVILEMAKNPNIGLSDIVKVVGSGRTRIRQFLERNGVTRVFSKSRKAEKSSQWSGGRSKTRDGYILIYSPDHPNRMKHIPYVYEHRLVMEKSIGRYLLPGEVVHHRNGVRDDNRIENLELFSSNGSHLKHELTGRVPQWSEDGKRSILEGVRRGVVTRRLNSNRKKASRDGQQCNETSRPTPS